MLDPWKSVPYGLPFELTAKPYPVDCLPGGRFGGLRKSPSTFAVFVSTRTKPSHTCEPSACSATNCPCVPSTIVSCSVPGSNLWSTERLPGRRIANHGLSCLSTTMSRAPGTSPLSTGGNGYSLNVAVCGSNMPTNIAVSSVYQRLPL